MSDEIPDFTLLSLQAQFLTDIEQVRIANGNRIRAMEHELLLVAGPEIERAKIMELELTRLELDATKDLQREVRKVPFYGFIGETIGLGDKQVARLLGVIGHPCWRFDNQAEQWVPRTVGQLWSYCGYGVVDGRAPSRRRGEQAKYNSDARTRCFKIAESCMKQRHSPYRVVYDEGREKYADAVHKRVCERCGPKGKPAEIGSALSDGHKHMRALRLVAKSFLEDLWCAASVVTVAA